MSLEEINNRPVKPNPFQDPELAPSTQEVVEQKVEVNFTEARSHMEEMLQMNYGVVHELLGQIAAINPFRPDSALGKQPEIAATEASKSVQSAPVAPVGKASASAYMAGLQHINDALTNHDMKLQQVFDQLALSRSGRKPDLFNHGVEYERLMSFIHQAEVRLHHLESLVPETLPENTGLSLKALMPEFSEGIRQYDAGFQQLLMAVREKIDQAEKAGAR